MEQEIMPGFTLREWADEDKPREKLMLRGKASLSDAELLAILLRSGSRDESVVTLSRKLLSRVHNDLNELATLGVKDLQQLGLRGLGETKALKLVAAMELGRRRQSAGIRQRKKITCSRDAYEYLYADLVDLQHEEFHVLLLNRANEVITQLKLSSGGITGTVADVRILFEQALKNKAVSVLIAHNHPSGQLRPSPDDISLTRKVKQSGEILSIPLFDHVIVGGKGYYSFADEGIL